MLFLIVPGYHSTRGGSLCFPTGGESDEFLDLAAKSTTLFASVGVGEAASWRCSGVFFLLDAAFRFWARFYLTTYQSTHILTQRLNCEMKQEGPVADRRRVY